MVEELMKQILSELQEFRIETNERIDKLEHMHRQTNERLDKLEHMHRQTNEQVSELFLQTKKRFDALKEDMELALSVRDRDIRRLDVATERLSRKIERQ